MGLKYSDMLFQNSISSYQRSSDRNIHIYCTAGDIYFQQTALIILTNSVVWDATVFVDLPPYSMMTAYLLNNYYDYGTNCSVSNNTGAMHETETEVTIAGHVSAYTLVTISPLTGRSKGIPLANIVD